MKKKWRISLATILVVLGTGITVVTANEEGIAEKSVSKQAALGNTELIPFQLLGINDFHGALNTTGSFYNDAGEKTANAGTAPLLAGYMNQAEEHFAKANIGAQTLRVQAGDMVGASPASSGLLQDEPTIKVLNQMKVSVGTIGNHEFDEGLAEFNRIMKGDKPANDPYGILADYPREASKTELVIGNVVKKGTEEIPFGWKPYTIKEVGTGTKKVKVGFIGVVTAEIPNLVLKEHYEQYDFLDEAQTIAYYASELKDKEKVNAIVVLAHIPATSKDNKVAGEAADIMNKVNKIYPENSVDVVFAGHNHQYTNGVVGQTRIVQSTSQGKGFIDVQGTLDPQTADFVETPKAQVLPVDPTDKDVPKSDEKVAEIVKDAEQRVASVTNKKIGTAKNQTAITREVNTNKESPLGNLVTDAQVAMARANGIKADFAMTNNGGIRADLEVGENRTITWGAAQAVQPFGNIMQVVKMTGAQIEQVLNEQYDEEERYFLQISGFTYTYEKTNVKETPYKVKKMLKKDGTPIQPQETYLVVINDFLFGGGDGFAGFTQSTLVNAIQPDTETFISYIEGKEAAGEWIDAAIEGRKTLVDANSEKPLEPTPKPPQDTDTSDDSDTSKDQTTAVEKLKAATIFDPLYAGDKYLMGVTLPRATISLFQGNAPETALETAKASSGQVVAQANEQGIIRIDVASFNLKEKETLTAVVSDQQQNKVKFLIEVQPKRTDKTDDSSLNSKELPESTTKKNLPQTGENHSLMYVVAGSTTVSLGIWFFLKKNG
ncbi:5'-nucleotidase C-terminal domain-containing protein [Enterococcus sp. UD-01]|jgi:5'-nucleotidase|uniref:5'-nucleotidase C-terminal domain-containing protein n=1 Tax=Enterococcus sp. UD-01 TaxID=3373911 RepID=UPI003838026E